jgi:hypothetical protein
MFLSFLPVSFPGTQSIDRGAPSGSCSSAILFILYSISSLLRTAPYSKRPSLLKGTLLALPANGRVFAQPSSSRVDLVANNRLVGEHPPLGEPISANLQVVDDTYAHPCSMFLSLSSHLLRVFALLAWPQWELDRSWSPTPRHNLFVRSAILSPRLTQYIWKICL